MPGEHILEDLNLCNFFLSYGLDIIYLVSFKCFIERCILLLGDMFYTCQLGHAYW